MDRVFVIPDVTPSTAQSLDSIFDKTPVRDIGEEYDEIPAKFTDLASWINRTNVHCMNCCLQFTTVPVPLTNNYQYNKITSQHELDVVGLCCSFECLLTTIIDTFHVRDTRWTVQTCAGIVANEFGISYDSIKAAMSRQHLKQFGGKISTKEFRSTLTLFDKKPTSQ